MPRSFKKSKTLGVVALSAMTALQLCACGQGEKTASWKLYKDSAISLDWYLILDMKYFGKEIQKEECQRLRDYYNQINMLRRFECRLTDTEEDVIR